MIIYDQNIWGNLEGPIANRNRIIRELIDDVNPDFCCFQECNPQTSRKETDPIQEILKPIYLEACPQYADKNFTPVFYKADKFDFTDGGYFAFEGLNDAGSKSITWAVFEEKETKKRIAIASTHFWWMARGEVDNNQRVENAIVVHSIAKEVIQKYNCPFIVSGDFNSGENKQTLSGYNKMTELGMKDVRFLAKKTDNSETCGECPVLENGEYVRGTDAVTTIDYSFVYGNVPVLFNRFEVVKSEKAKISSDHRPLVIEFEI